MIAPENSPPTRALRAFCRRVDAFSGDPRAVGFAAALAPNAVPTPATTEDALASHLDDALNRLGAETPGDAFQLRKTLTLHDGRVVSTTGDATPLGAAEGIRVVTTTATVLDAERLRVETNVLVFERDRP